MTCAQPGCATIRVARPGCRLLSAVVVEGSGSQHDQKHYGYETADAELDPGFQYSKHRLKLLQKAE